MEQTHGITHLKDVAEKNFIRRKQNLTINYFTGQCWEPPVKFSLPLVHMMNRIEVVFYADASRPNVGA